MVGSTRIGLFGVMGLLLLMTIAACGGAATEITEADGDQPDPTTAPVATTLPATTTTMVLATTTTTSREGPTATYTGGACDYDGPSEFEVNSTVTFTVTNESDNFEVGFAVFKFPEGTTAEEVFNEGIFNVVDMASARIIFRQAPTALGTEYELTMTFSETGQHGINCFDLGHGETESGDFVTMFTVGE